MQMNANANGSPEGGHLFRRRIAPLWRLVGRSVGRLVGQSARAPSKAISRAAAVALCAHWLVTSCRLVSGPLNSGWQVALFSGPGSKNTHRPAGCELNEPPGAIPNTSPTLGSTLAAPKPKAAGGHSSALSLSQVPRAFSMVSRDTRLSALHKQRR